MVTNNFMKQIVRVVSSEILASNTSGGKVQDMQVLADDLSLSLTHTHTHTHTHTYTHTHNIYTNYRLPPLQTHTLRLVHR